MNLIETDEVVLTLMTLVLNNHLNDHPSSSKMTDNDLVHMRDHFQARERGKAAVLVEAIRCRTTGSDPESALMDFLPSDEGNPG